MMFYELSFLIPFFVFYVFYIYFDLRKQNILITASSYYFYGLWDWRFLSLLIIQTGSDYICARIIDKNINNQKIKKIALIFSITFNLSMLGFFKYANFFVESFLHAFPYFGNYSEKFLQLVLPAAISFYTFESMSYVIDVYRGTIKAEKDIIGFAAFISFFPKLVAGPIERAHTLLAQINQQRKCTFEGFLSGSRLFVWGLFKKLVVADNLGALAEPIFSDPSKYDSFTLLLGAYCFTLQIYGDFSGYTDMARGLSRMMGMELSLNFNLPYLSTSITDFWRRWHMTLGSWLRDYIYIPLGGSRTTLSRNVINLMITFFASGLWHGANWTFVTWGILYGLLTSIETIFSKSSYNYLTKYIPTWIKIVLTFHIVVILWVIFRCNSISTAWVYLSKMFSMFDFSILKSFLKMILYSKTWPDVMDNTLSLLSPTAVRHLILFSIYGITLLTIHLVQYIKENKEFDMQIGIVSRSLIYSIVIYQLIMLGAQNAVQFIYFQF